MKEYPNYRVAVEGVIKKADKVLLMKRAINCDVAPGVWSVPAGKVKYDEIPIMGVVRECKEETGFDVRVIRELDCRTFTGESSGNTMYRLVYTYLVEILDGTDACLTVSDEHSEYAWVDKDEIMNSKYNSLFKELKDIILKILS